MEKFELLWQLSKIADNACYGYLYDTANRFYDKVKANYNNKRLVKEATAFVETYKDY